MKTLKNRESLVNENFFYNRGLNLSEKKFSGSRSFKSALKKIRNFLILPELPFSNIAESFTLNAIVFGPSISLSGPESGKPGIVYRICNYPLLTW
jgi:hypothetical protein